MLDLESREFLRDPYKTYSWLRENAPVARFEPLNCFVVTKHADVKYVLNNSYFSSGAGRYLKGVATQKSSLQEAAQPFVDSLRRMTLFKDGVNHVCERRASNHGFSPEKLTRLSSVIRKECSEIVETLNPKGFDAVSEFAFHVPTIAICHLLGIPSEDRMATIAYADSIADFFVSVNPSEEELVKAIDAHKSLFRYFELLFLSDEPREHSLLPMLKNYYGTDNEGLKNCIANAILLLFGGQETTRSLISTSIYLMLKNNLWEAMIEQPNKLTSVIWESMRYESPVQFVARVAIENCEISEVGIPSGAPVLAFIGSANRDPEVFEEPNRFDYQRKQKNNLAFGSGPHKCIGASLAILEAKIAIEELLPKFGSISLVDDSIVWHRHIALRRLEGLNLRQELKTTSRKDSVILQYDQQK